MHGVRHELAGALSCGEFIPYFQPKVDLRSKHVIGVEVLARWEHPVCGLVLPKHFVHILEEQGLITVLFEQIMRRSLEHVNEWQRDGHQVNIAVNVSPLTLQDPNIVDVISGLASEYAVASHHITLEVTETALPDHRANVLKAATKLREKGFQLSIDDFGSGYSSLVNLNEMPFNELKIDRALVTSGTSSPKSWAILESVIVLADRLGMQTVAEGIQSPHQWRILTEMGCRAGQSFYIAKPMSYSDTTNYFDRNQSLTPLSFNAHLM